MEPLAREHTQVGCTGFRFPGRASSGNFVAREESTAPGLPWFWSSRQ